jgi:5-formyltetrahydrofolate cyclo-ligase
MDEGKIKRINELYRKQKEGTLTEEEKKEQSALRAEYIAAIRTNIQSTLENVSIQEKDGTIHKLQKKKRH